jgi:aryl-alcohol dehydrogenase-like predicted oxidoreductase
LDCSLSQLAIAWCLKNENVSSVITGASNPQQVEENMHAIHVKHQLTDQVMDLIESAVGTGVSSMT